MFITRTFVIAMSAAIMLPLLVVAPALASPKGVTYSNGLAGIVKKHDDYCSDTHDRLIAAEVGAEADAGTPQGLASEKDADAQWQKGVDAGCGWAA